MKLNVVKVAETVGFDTSVYGLDLMVEPALKYRDAAKHKVSITRAFYGTGIVDIEDMHWEAVTTKRPSGGRSPGRPRKRSPPSR